MSRALYDEIDTLQETNRQLRAQIAELTGAHLVSDLTAVAGLTVDQARILALLLHRRGRVVFKPVIYEAIWGGDPDGGPDPKIIDVVVCHVRGRLRSLGVKIATVWGQGYRLDRDQAAKLDDMLAALGGGV